MELPEIGEQCGHPHCKLLDFLPFICKCKGTFCYNHFKGHKMYCPELAKDKKVEVKKIEGVYKCSHAGCKETSIVALICEKCKQHFCIAHRHIIECFKEDPSVRAAAIEKMMAPVQQFQEAKLAVDKQIDHKISNMKKENRNTEMANKLQLMRVKNKATGSKTIPSTDRVYFNVRLPKKLGDKSTVVFISKTWTVGRALDAIAAEAKVQNNNNVSGGLKLRLFHGDSGKIISDCVSVTISDLVDKNYLIDGQNLILEYVVDDCKEVKL